MAFVQSGEKLHRITQAIISVSLFPVRKKLTQLQHAYTCLFRDYDTKLKAEVKHVFILTHSIHEIMVTCLILICVIIPGRGSLQPAGRGRESSGP